MTASSTRRSRGVSSSGVAISSNMLMTSVVRQGAGERIEPEPAEWGAAEPVVVERHPSRDSPWLDEVTFARGDGKADVASQPEIHGLGNPVLLREPFGAFERIGVGEREIAPGGVGASVPPSGRAIEAMRGRSE